VLRVEEFGFFGRPFAAGAYVCVKWRSRPCLADGKQGPAIKMSLTIDPQTPLAVENVKILYFDLRSFSTSKILKNSSILGIP
jgi:hypothetical protein